MSTRLAESLREKSIDPNSRQVLYDRLDRCFDLIEVALHELRVVRQLADCKQKGKERKGKEIKNIVTAVSQCQQHCEQSAASGRCKKKIMYTLLVQLGVYVCELHAQHAHVHQRRAPRQLAVRLHALGNDVFVECNCFGVLEQRLPLLDLLGFLEDIEQAVQAVLVNPESIGQHENSKGEKMACSSIIQDNGAFCAQRIRPHNSATALTQAPSNQHASAGRTE